GTPGQQGLRSDVDGQAPHRAGAELAPDAVGGLEHRHRAPWHMLDELPGGGETGDPAPDDDVALHGPSLAPPERDLIVTPPGEPDSAGAAPSGVSEVTRPRRWRGARDEDPGEPAPRGRPGDRGPGPRGGGGLLGAVRERGRTCRGHGGTGPGRRWRRRLG